MARHRSTGRGEGVQRANPPSVLLFNFDIDSPVLKLEHREMLRSWVVPYLNRGYSISIVGLASRTGTTAHNQHLSQTRADNTLAVLQSEKRDGFNARSTIGFGELKAAAEGERDNTEDSRFRSVLILWEPGPKPPAPPPKIDLALLVPKDFAREKFSLDAGQINDLVSGLVGMIENMGPELSDAAELVFGTLDVGTAALGVVLGMRSLWKGVRDQNEANGLRQGYWEGVQDMASQYSSPGLAKKPPNQWAAIVEPRPRSIGNSGSLNEREWMEGKEKGCRIAFVIMTTLEANMPGAGRYFLYMLWSQYGSNLSEELKRAIIVKSGAWPKIEF